jgi:hypothetical protein
MCAVLVGLLTIDASQSVAGRVLPSTPPPQLLPSANEIVISAGVQLAPPADINEFVRTLDMAFIGRATGVSVEFLSGDPDRVYTEMRFRPTEWIKRGSLTNEPAEISVWTMGGSYLETAGGRRPHKPHRVGQDVVLGGAHFVPITHLDVVPVKGLYLLKE